MPRTLLEPDADSTIPIKVQGLSCLKLGIETAFPPIIDSFRGAPHVIPKASKAGALD